MDEVEYLGADIEDVRCEFMPAYKREPKTSLAIIPGALKRSFNRLIATYPKVDDEKCVGCGECANACPEETICIENGKAKINYKKCIRCYCCQEMCPIVAIKIDEKRNRMG